MEISQAQLTEKRFCGWPGRVYISQDEVEKVTVNWDFWVGHSQNESGWTQRLKKKSGRNTEFATVI